MKGNVGRVLAHNISQAVLDVGTFLYKMDGIEGRGVGVCQILSIILIFVSFTCLLIMQQ